MTPTGPQMVPVTVVGVDQEEGGSGSQTGRRDGSGRGREGRKTKTREFPTIATLPNPQKCDRSDSGYPWRAG